MRYVVKVEIGGVLGLLAPVVGKQPPEHQIWISRRGGSNFSQMAGPSLRVRSSLDNRADKSGLAE